MNLPSISRRGALAGGASFAAWAYAVRLSSAAGAPDPRFLFINLRGAMDGLSLAAPFGDPDYEIMRQGLIIDASQGNREFALDDLFLLNPNMPNLLALWRGGDALLFHATATPYRERSHFDGQDVLESGQPLPGLRQTGWMNRLLGALPKGDRVAVPQGLGLGASTPLVLKGPNRTISWMPPGFREAERKLADKLLDLYNHTDKDLAGVLSEGLRLQALVGGETAMQSSVNQSMDAEIKGAKRQFTYNGVVVGKLMASADGPRVAAMNLPGWDTHFREGPLDGRMARLLRALDGAIGGLHQEMKSVWHETVIIIATEFGRTVKMNGTKGTDHGTATTAIAIGGALKGGRVIADWPGLAEGALFEGRDLMPTSDLRAVLKGLIGEHMGVAQSVLSGEVFPGSEAVRPLAGLLRKS